MKKEIKNKIDDILSNLKNDCGDGTYFLLAYVHKKSTKIGKKYKERLVIKIEKKYSVKLSRDEYVKTKTIGDLTDIIYKKLNERP